MIELLIISIPVVLFVIGLLIINTVGSLSDWTLPGFILSFVGGVGVLLCLLVFPIERIAVYAKIDAFEATRKSYETMRADKRDFESFSIYEDIAENNRWLAKKKRYRAMGFTFIVPEEINELEPIR